MEKKIIIDDKDVFSFDGKKLKPLGQACEMKDIWQGKIFTVENYIYLKTGDEFSLLVENFYDVYGVEIGESEKKQFELVDDVLFMNEYAIFATLMLAGDYAPYLDWTLSWEEEPILFVVRQKDDKDEDEVLVVIKDENGNIRLSAQKAVYLDSDGTLLCWKHRIYKFSYDSAGFYLSSLYLLFEGDNYLVFRNDDDEDDNEYSAAIAIGKNGKVTPLGTEPNIVKTQNATLLESSKGVYHLKQDKYRLVAKVYDSEEPFFIHDDGTIVHNYFIEQPYAPDIPREDTYRLVNGNYKLVKRKDQ